MRSLTEVVGRRPWVAAVVGGLIAVVSIYLGHGPGPVTLPDVHLDCSAAVVDVPGGPATMVPVVDNSGSVVAVAGYKEHIDCLTTSRESIVGFFSAMHTSIRDALLRAGVKLGTKSPQVLCTYCGTNVSRLIVGVAVALMGLLLFLYALLVNRRLRQLRQSL